MVRYEANKHHEDEEENYCYFEDAQVGTVNNLVAKAGIELYLRGDDHVLLITK
jgi:hypothetical protein